MTKQQFIENYIVSFIAADAVKKYDPLGGFGEHEAVCNPPYEDAHYLALNAWDKLVKEYDGTIGIHTKESWADIERFTFDPTH